MVNFSKVFANALNNLLSRPILLILMSFFFIVVIAELEFIDNKPTTWLSKNINETNFGGKYLKKIVDKAEANLYFLTLAYGLLVLGIFINGVKYLFLIHIVIIAILSGINITKDSFLTIAFMILLEYFYFVIKIFVIRIALIIAFILSFYIELEVKTKTSDGNETTTPKPVSATTAKSGSRPGNG